MAEEIAAITEWAFMGECPIPRDVAAVLAPGEKPVKAYKTMRDTAIFTTHRIIFRDYQGMRGKKVDMYSLPYKSIEMWASENSGALEVASELKLWTRVGFVRVRIGRGIDIRALDGLISQGVLSR